MKRDYHKWFSKELGREMELLVHGHAGSRVLVFPTRGGRFFDFENWRLVESLRHHIEQGWIQLFCVDSVDNESFYCDWAHPSGRIQRHQEYERYLLNEVLPFTLRQNPNPCLMSLGCSMGAYHAMNIALRHPHLFKRVLSLSGRYALNEQNGSFRDLLDGWHSEDVYLHMPCHYLKDMPEGEQLDRIRALDIRFVVGVDDEFYQNNLYFRWILESKGISHTFLCWDGESHRARYWRQMLPQYI